MKIIDSIYKLVGTDGRVYVLSNHMVGIGGLMDFMRKAIYGKEKCYYKTVAFANGRVARRVSSLGYELQHLWRYAMTFDPNQVHHPLLKFFYEEFRRHPLKECEHMAANDIAFNGMTVIKLFEDFTAQMCTSALKIKLKKQVSDWDSKHKKAQKALDAFEPELFRRYARLCVVRVDGTYRAAQFTPDEIHEVYMHNEAKNFDRWNLFEEGAVDVKESLLDVRVGFETVQADRQRLFAKMKGMTSVFKHLVAYAWCYEFTPVAGYHAHFAFFFDGSKVQKDEYLAQQIGEYWVNEITEGRGRYHSCNAAWDKSSPRYALGQVDHYDMLKRKALRENVLPYLGKESQSVRVLPYPGCNVYGCGFVHREKGKRAGRARSKGALGAESGTANQGA